MSEKKAHVKYGTSDLMHLHARKSEVLDDVHVDTLKMLGDEFLKNSRFLVSFTLPLP